MILSFGDVTAEKIYLGERLSRKELRRIGNLDIDKAQQRLAVLNRSTENDLLALPMLHYHALRGTKRY